MRNRTIHYGVGVNAAAVAANRLTVGIGPSDRAKVASAAASFNVKMDARPPQRPWLRVDARPSILL